MGRVAGTLFLIGSAMTVLGILLPHSPKVDVGGFWAMAGGTGLAALLLFHYSQRLSVRSYELCMLIASLTITLSLYFNGERHGGPSAGNQVLYVWVALYAGYFFSRRAMVAQLGVIAALYAGVLIVIHPGPVGLTRWLITVGMVSAAALIVHALKIRTDDLLERLARAARTDPLTGLLNRQAFDERLKTELARCRRNGQPLALIMADIDYFKERNDSQGHACGDAALRIVGDTARQVSRGADYAARIGGDEFAAILSGTDAEGAFLFAERMREGIRMSQETDDVPLTMSLGIAEWEADGLTPEMLSRAADEALYEAKGLGRNQTVVAQGARRRLATRATRRRSARPGSQPRQTELLPSGYQGP
ncbi:MAG TPA: GGDEF domain-containing protein [Solirubrobacteraceae bacterium]|nr:GGDEF domain-containing protein [Solirubrobacteraceae bacterium]